MAHVMLASEDEALIAQFTATIEAEGHTITVASNGLEAYTQANAEQPVLVLLDEVLGVHGALETAEIIRNDPELPADIPILILTGDDMDPRKLSQSGATGQLARDSGSVSIRDAVVRLIGDKL